MLKTCLLNVFVTSNYPNYFQVCKNWRCRLNCVIWLFSHYNVKFPRSSNTRKWVDCIINFVAIVTYAGSYAWGRIFTGGRIYDRESTLQIEAFTTVVNGATTLSIIGLFGTLSITVSSVIMLSVVARKSHLKERKKTYRTRHRRYYGLTFLSMSHSNLKIDRKIAIRSFYYHFVNLLFAQFNLLHDRMTSS